MNIKLPVRVYADTTVFGGIVDHEFERGSRVFLDQVRSGQFTLVTSAMVRDEISKAPSEVQELFAEFAIIAEEATIGLPATNLRDRYLAAGFVRRKSFDDALHVATATVSGCSIIVSWNFRDIVNFRKIPLYNAVNALAGYGAIGIFAPPEVIDDEG